MMYGTFSLPLVALHRSVLDSPCLLGSPPSYIFITMPTSRSMSVHSTSFSSLVQNICTACCFVIFKEAPDSASSQPLFRVHLEYKHSWLMCSRHFSGFDLTGWLLSSVGHSWSHHFPGGHFVLSRAPVSGPLLPSLATRVQFSIPGIPLYLSILTFIFKCLTCN